MPADAPIECFHSSLKCETFYLNIEQKYSTTIVIDIVTNYIKNSTEVGLSVTDSLSKTDSLIASLLPSHFLGSVPISLYLYQERTGRDDEPSRRLS